MGRLDDIIERNKNPKASFRKPGKQAPAAPPAPVVETTAAPPAAPAADDARPEGSRLAKIIARNRNPNRNFKWLKVGLAGVVLFVVLILLIFTDLATPPDDHRLQTPATEQPRGVGGVKLWKQPVKQPAPAR